MKEQIHERIRKMFDVPVMQNNLRGLWVEIMVCELLGQGWKYTGNDWAGWDLEHEDGFRVEVKQSARAQTWGVSANPPRFSIAVAKGHYPDGKIYERNVKGARLADIYIFAWHEGQDQTDVSEWVFYVVESRQLPKDQKSLGLRAIQKIAEPVSASNLRARVMEALR